MPEDQKSPEEVLEVKLASLEEAYQKMQDSEDEDREFPKGTMNAVTIEQYIEGTLEKNPALKDTYGPRYQALRDQFSKMTEYTANFGKKQRFGVRKRRR